MSASTTDFPTKKSDIYENILHDSVFLNELWHSFEATDKASVSEKAGFDLYEEWQEYQKEITHDN